MWERIAGSLAVLTLEQLHTLYIAYAVLVVCGLLALLLWMGARTPVGQPFWRYWGRFWRSLSPYGKGVIIACGILAALGAATPAYLRSGGIGDTRDYAGADLGARIAACLANPPVPTKPMCDATRDTGTPTISTTVQIPSSAKVWLPSETITWNAQPAFKFTGTGSQLIGAITPQGATDLTAGTHGIAVEFSNDFSLDELHNLYIDYSVLAGGISTNPDDKGVVNTGGTSYSPQHQKVQGVRCDGAYDCFYEGNYTSALLGTLSATNSNVSDYDDLTAWHVGNSVFTMANGVHDQVSMHNVGADGSMDLTGAGCLFVANTNNLDVNQAWCWHVNDPGAGTGGAPASFSAMQFQASEGRTSHLDFEASVMRGSSQGVFYNAGTYVAEDISEYAITWGGAEAGTQYQELIRNDLGTLNLAGVFLNGVKSVPAADTCNSTGGTVNDAVIRANGNMFLPGVLSTLPTMPSGTNCAPLVDQAFLGTVYDSEYDYTFQQQLHQQWIQVGPGSGNGYYLIGKNPTDSFGNTPETFYAEGLGSGSWGISGWYIAFGVAHMQNCANLTGTPPNLGTPTGCSDVFQMYAGGANPVIFDNTGVASGASHFTFSPAGGLVPVVPSSTAVGQVPVFDTTTGSLKGTSFIWQGSGVPTASCAVGALYSNSAASSASTVLYVCYPANTWNAVTVP